MTSRRVTVPLGPTAYDVVIGPGLLATLAEVLARACPAERYAIIADEAVAARYAEPVRRSVASYRPCDVFTFPPGEASKSRAQWGALTDALLSAGLGRDAAVVALGGGVSGDLAGFVAATYLRGVPYVQVPTSLLAMVDSSVGGKTAVDTPLGKNLVGAFHQPRGVVADTDTLASLPEDRFTEGLAEAVKHGAIADAAYFERITNDAAALRRRESDPLVDLVARSVEIKAEVVAADEHEAGRRAVLNFGHTIGHALEAAAGYGLPHGHAVAAGMVMEAELGARLGVTARGVPATLRQTLARLALPITASLPPADRFMAAIRADKKNRGGTVNFALLESIGRMAVPGAGKWTFSVPSERVAELLEGVVSK